MLVLSRRPHDAIMIGHDIVVTVLSVTRDHVRIGIQAPPNVEVQREEVYVAIQEQNRLSASPTVGALEGLAAVVTANSEMSKSTASESTADQPSGHEGDRKD